ncbi:MAG TPA: sialidase family protein [Streptosporangiaceae bacterium]
MTAAATWTLAAPAIIQAQAAVTVQRLGYCGGDDWEPAMAADATHVYVLITHYAGNTSCDPASGLNNSRIMIQVSGDGGHTFSAPAVVAATPGGQTYPDQADPSIAIDKSTGAVYVSFLAYGQSGGHTDIYVAKSTDGGQTFGQAVQANAKGCKNCDHEKILASGNVVYDAYTQGSSHFISVSADGGATFTQHLVDSTDVVGFAETGVLDAQGNAWFAWGDCQTSNCTGAPAADYRVSETSAGTGTTTFSPPIAQAPQGPNCPYSKCGFAYFGPQDALAMDSAGTFYLAWQDGQVHTQAKSPTIINLSRCSSGCLSAANWTLVGRVDDKTAANCPSSACYALFPNLVAAGPGQLYATWIDDRNDSVDGTVDHVDGYNLYYRASVTGGSTWTTAGQQISQSDPAQSQETAAGFLFPYGDYTGLIMNTTCATPAPAMTWGEGHTWTGGAAAPGHIEFASLC